MNEGWILDCHLDIKTECMSLWIKKDDGEVRQILMPWSFTIHVHGESHRLDELGRALSRPEYQRPFGDGKGIVPHMIHKNRWKSLQLICRSHRR